MKSLLAALLVAGGALDASDGAEQGKELYRSQKFGCHQCHGPTGAEGGPGPSFAGIGARYDRDQLMERAAHNCPPTGACDPKQLAAIVDYLRTL
jgi:mono/diheme cytochrome c family protein